MRGLQTWEIGMSLSAPLVLGPETGHNKSVRVCRVTAADAFSGAVISTLGAAVCLWQELQRPRNT